MRRLSKTDAYIISESNTANITLRKLLLNRLRKDQVHSSS